MAEQATPIAPDAGGLPPFQPAPTLPQQPAAPPRQPDAGTLSRREAARAAGERAVRHLTAVQGGDQPQAPQEPAPAPSQQPPQQAAPQQPQAEPAPQQPQAAPEGVPQQSQAEPGQPQAVEIPAWHPLRGQNGVTSLPFQTPEQERVLKGLFTHASRTMRELERAVQERDAAIEENLYARARGQAETQWHQSPEYAEAMGVYRQLQQDEEDGRVRPGTAEAYLRGQMSTVEQLTEQHHEQQMAERRQEMATMEGARFRDEVYAAADNVIPDYIRALPGYGQWFSEAFDTFVSKVRLRHYPDVQQGDRRGYQQKFMTHLRSSLLAYPEAAAAARSRAAQRGAAPPSSAAGQPPTAPMSQATPPGQHPAVQQFVREAAARRQQSPPHPLGALPNVARERAPTDGEPAGPETTAPQSVPAFRRSLKQRAGDRAAAAFQRGAV